MAARIVEGLFTCTKRWDLEGALVAAGHRWPKAPNTARVPMSGAELVGRILCWLDGRDDPQGRFFDADGDDVERAAHWVGKAGLLVEALIETGWIDKTPEGMRWHDYASLNRLTIHDRNKKRRKRGDEEGDELGDRSGDKTGDKPKNRGDKTGASGSGSGESSEGFPSGTRARGAPGGALGAVPGGETAPALRIGPPRGMRWSSREGGFVIVDQAEFDAAKAEAATRGETFP